MASLYNKPHRIASRRVLVLAGLSCFLPPAAKSDSISFDPVVIDSTNPGNPHCKTLGDIDGDGFIDALAASSMVDGLFWYEYPTWNKHRIASGAWTTDMQVGDVDGDGDLDVILGEHMGATRLLLFENQSNGTVWVQHLVDAGGAGIDHHDGTHPVDIDSDGDLDIISMGWFNDKVWLFENKAIDGSTPADTTPPSLQSVTAAGNPNQLRVRFDEIVDTTTAETPGHYAIDLGISVTGATLGGDGRTVTLTTSTMSEGLTYTLTVTNVQDAAGNPMATPGEAAFSFIVIDISSGRVAHFPFDDGSGAIAADASGNGHHGTRPKISAKW